MPTISQHQGAELWELARDHFVASAKLAMFASHVHDQQLRSTLEQQSRRNQQIGQQLEGFFGDGGAHATGAAGFQQQFQSSGFQQSFQTAGQTGTSGAFQSGHHAFDIVAASDSLMACKHMAVDSIRGATEASQPARNFLYQIAGEHLQSADHFYRWLDQRGIYASPKADFQATNEYTQKLRQITQFGQQVAQTYSGQSHQTFAQNWQQPSSFQQPTYSGTSSFGSGQQFRQ